MVRDDVITLIKETKTKNALGVYTNVRTYKDVFCSISSIGQKEFFEAGRSGLNPVYRMSLFFGDYDNETLLEYKGKTYSIYRTYLTGSDILELYVERKGGTNGKEQHSNTGEITTGN